MWDEKTAASCTCSNSRMIWGSLHLGLSACKACAMLPSYRPSPVVQSLRWDSKAAQSRLDPSLNLQACPLDRKLPFWMPAPFLPFLNFATCGRGAPAHVGGNTFLCLPAKQLCLMVDITCLFKGHGNERCVLENWSARTSFAL